MSATVQNFIHSATDQLKKKGVLQARQESEWILGHVLGVAREALYLKFEKTLSQQEEETALSLLSERLKGKPLPYILGSAFFYKYHFFVNPHVLIPRVETEEVLRKALEWMLAHPPYNRCVHRILDMGAGSGCIGLSLLREIKSSHLLAMDVSKEALKVVSMNAKRLGVMERLTLLHKRAENLTSKDFPGFFQKKIDVIVANPPYIDQDSKKIQALSYEKQKAIQMKSGNFSRDIVQESVYKYEPHLSLFASKKGFQFFPLWSKVAFQVLDTPGFYCVEVGNDKQARRLHQELKKKSFFDKILIHEDLFKRKRVLCCEKRHPSPSRKS